MLKPSVLDYKLIINVIMTKGFFEGMSIHHKTLTKPYFILTMLCLNINMLYPNPNLLGDGWDHSTIGWFWGGMTVQGVLPYYYNVVTAPGDTLILTSQYVYKRTSYEHTPTLLCLRLARPLIYLNSNPS